MTRRAAHELTDDEMARRNLEAIHASPSYVLAQRDLEMLARPELRPVRMQLELLKPELAFGHEGIDSTVVIFGSTQIVERRHAEDLLAAAERALAADPHNSMLSRAVARRQKAVDKSHYYDEARELARLITTSSEHSEFVVVTGGGPGIMEAANRGAFDVGQKSIGLNITLPSEQSPNPYITPSLCFQFHYFAMRKMHFLLRAKALVVFPGGFGTIDELFDALTLRQTNRMQHIPIILYGNEYWRRVIDFQYLADEGAIQDEHLTLMQFADAPAEAWNAILEFYANPPKQPPTETTEG